MWLMWSKFDLMSISARPSRLGACLLAVAVPLAGLVGVVAGAQPAGATTKPGPAQINALRARAVQVENEIQHDALEVQLAAETYDEYMTKVAADKVLVAKTGVLVGKAAAQVAGTRRQLADATVSAYVTADGAAASMGNFLTSSPDESQLVSTYDSTATRSLDDAIAAYSANEAHLRGLQAQQLGEEHAAAEAAARAHAAEVAAEQATAAANKLLVTVRGQLAQAIEAYKRALAAAAAAAAKRARLAAERAAAAAAAARAALKAQLEQDAKTANSGQGGAGTLPPVFPEAGSSAGYAALRSAESFVGVPYVWGGASRKGVDCSGLTMLAWDAAGIFMEHGATAQYLVSTPVTLGQLQPGDLLFYHFANDGPWPITHVAMYVGSGPYGTDTIIQAEQTGTNVGYFPIYYQGFVGAGRP